MIKLEIRKRIFQQCVFEVQFKPLGEFAQHTKAFVSVGSVVPARWSLWLGVFLLKYTTRAIMEISLRKRVVNITKFGKGLHLADRNI